MAKEPAMSLFRETRRALRVLLDGRDGATLWRLGAANAMALTGGALAGLAPVALKRVIDTIEAQGTQATTPDATATLAASALAYLGCLSLVRFIGELRPWLIGGAEQRLYAGLRIRYVEHLLALPLSFHLARRTGALSHHLQQALAGYQVILSSLVNGLVPVLVEMATVVVVLISVGQPSMAASFGLTAIALWCVAAWHMPGLRTAASGVTQASALTHGLLADTLVNYEPIKCFGAEWSTLDRFRERAMGLTARWQQLQQRRFLMGSAVATIFLLSVAMSMAIAIDGVTRGDLSLGGFVLACAYMVQIIRPLELLSSAARDLSQAMAFIRPLLEILGTAPGDTPAGATRPAGSPASTQATGTTAPPRHPGVGVSFRHVRLSYDDGEPVLRDLNLDIPAGRSLALVGGSGCGKSSLARLLLRLWAPDEGCIALDGRSIDAHSLEELRSMIAVVPQDIALLDSTIGANIAFGNPGATHAAITEAAELAGLHSLVAALPKGYDTLIGERGLKLSGGERQRIAIARAILKDPRLYVLDEATSMLDTHTEHRIMNNIRRTSQGRTVLMIVHRLAAARHADEIAVLAEGCIAERGSHAALMARRGLYAAMWHTQHASEPCCTFAEIDKAQR
jgi:ABC-type multidrug transport system fused ATPase/permease subunit